MATVLLQVETLEHDSVQDVKTFSGPVELGRQLETAEGLFSVRPLSAADSTALLEKQPPTGPRDEFSPLVCRYVIAAMTEYVISRHHAVCQLEGDNQVRITNLSGHVGIRIGKSLDLLPGQTVTVPLPTRLLLGGLPGGRVLRLAQSLTIRGQTVQLEPPPGYQDPKIRKLDRAAGTISFKPDLPAQLGSQLVEGDTTQVEEVIRWLHSALGVLQAATSDADFFQRAAQSVVDDVRCDRGAVLLLQGQEWRVEAYFEAEKARPKPNWRPSGSFLAQVLQEKRTCWQSLDQAISPDSLLSVDMVVGAPILDERGAVRGVLYGECDLEPNQPLRNRMTRLEATLVDVLASSVANGLARLQQQKATIAAEVRFDQFFTPELSQELARNPDLLQGQEREVTILFADIRGFSKLSERLGPALTVDWINDIMNDLSDCVLRHSGVLVDYLGDELMAMWGAPADQPDHPSRAARAALEMIAALPELNARWRNRLDEPIRLGIGLNTGIAHVGNTGSRHKFKYGPLGHMVNLAERLQGATKYLRVPILLSESTAQKLTPGFLTRRLCSVRVVNIQNPVALYELSFPDAVEWDRRCEQYAHSLRLFEEAAELPEEVKRLAPGLRTAAKELGQLLSEYPDDGPAMVLLSRVVNVLANENYPFQVVWDLPGK